MRERAEWRGALSAMAAISGVGLTSGRELVLFFGQLKGAAWVGVPTACGLFGLLTALMASREDNLPARGGLERIFEALRLLYASLVAALMLVRLGELGALTLPLRHGYGFGVGLGLLAALVWHWTDADAPLGLGLTLALCAFYAANALDGRPPKIHLRGEAEFSLAGSTGAALALAGVYAAMTGCAAAWGLRGVKRGAVRPAALGIKAAALMGVALIPACAALLRGGDAVLVQPMPWVVLSARWGLAGFWLCAGLSAACAAATLSQAMGFLLSRTRGASRSLAVYAIIVGVIVLCAMCGR